MHEDNIPDLSFAAGGIPYALAQLGPVNLNSRPPSAEDRKLATLLLTRELTQDVLLTLVDLALHWVDIDLWKGILKKVNYQPLRLGTGRLARAWETFSFEVLCAG